MSFIDYSQTAEDHQSLLVLVRHTGTHLSNQNFSAAWEHVKKLSCIHVQGQKRNVYVRYKRGYPKENNAWGDYQTHRKVLGLVSIGRCSSVKEFEDLFEDYKKIKDEYANTIYNSRLIVFGMNTDGTPIEKESEINSNTNSSSGKEEINCDRGNGSVVTDKRNGQINKDNKILDSNHKEIEKRPHSNSLTKESTGAEVVFYPNLETMTDLEERLREFITSLFYVLEGKRLDRSFERADRLQLLCAPFEKKDFVGVDTDTRTFKKKCTGRLRKHLADLCLQAGMPGEAILHYQTAIDLLRSVNDFLWIGGCFEGLSSSSVIMAYPKMATNAASIKRNLSFTDKRAATLVNEKTSRTATLSNNYANGLDLAEVAGSNPGLNPDDIIEKYREAITHYSKFKSAGMIEMEASLKACRVLIGQRVSN
ncbi:hypothetical protein SNE40_021403 [Patella caerulea]|uniref:Trs120/TRAPPC9 N-terminal domain-containing protein n=1 Tax=Patella caerulea TaxID=87958 RepID=A0AAN8GIP5_PATCE